MQYPSKKNEGKNLLSFSSCKKDFFFCIAAVFILGLAAHAYGFMQDSFSHDSLNSLYAGSVETVWKMRTGRYLAPVYRYLTRGALSMPWTIGLLTLVWIGLALWLIVRMFDIKSRVQIFFIAGILTTNACVSSLTATYIHDLDIDMFALLAGAAAAFLWQKKGWLPLVCGGILTSISLALYQSYIGATAVIILFYSFGALYRGERVKKVFLSCLKALAMFLIGGALYFIGMKLSSGICDRISQDIAEHSFSSLSQTSLASMLWGMRTAAIQFFGRLLFLHTGYSIPVRIFLCALTLIPIVAVLVRMLIKKISMGAKLLALLLCALVPVAAGVSCLFSHGANHELMFYPVYMIYAFALVMLYPQGDETDKKPLLVFRSAFICGLCIMLGLNIFTANGMYLKKDMEQDAALSLMTRVLYRVEEQADYVPQETPVAFFGNSKLIQPSPEMAPYSQYVGTGSPVPFRAYLQWYYNTYEPYFKYKLGNPILLCETEKWLELYYSEEIEAMPAYPAEGCVKMIDGVMAVKLGEYKIPD